MTKSETCPEFGRINEVLARVGDRWSVLLVISMARNGASRFNALKHRLGISQRMLSVTLKALERDGLVVRTHYPQIPPKVEYALSDMGLSFHAAVDALGYWAVENLEAIDAARALYDDGLIDE
ncbi:MAG: helix-turn-helix domain-containing protein [Luminiphilus sp.]|nr:helix-turn-helix domain-containing protein [Luminiphilus sp.]